MPAMSDRNYENEFTFPLWQMIKAKAEASDISYVAASDLVLPEYCKTLHVRDKHYEQIIEQARVDELAAIEKYREERIKKGGI